uniref:Variant surface glycoprotein 1125.4776 n=1 Tax=Trypanosoma brucei TaxID=5691 RepID=A0A1J0RB12_9TRYP|nr:variant surface glycoprotein 1125.4776 [Trypanosoma brucei]
MRGVQQQNQGKGLIFHSNLVLTTAVFLLILRRSDETTAHEKSSTSGFQAICQIITLATQDVHPTALHAPDASIESTLALFNLTISAPKALQELAAAEAQKTAIEKDSSSAKIHCTDKAKELCLKAAARANTHGNDKIALELKQAAREEQVKAAINNTLMQLHDLLAKFEQQKVQTKQTTVSSLLLKALGAKADGTTSIKLTGYSTDLATTCGKPNTENKGTAAGKTIAVDTICHCASDSTNTNNKTFGTKVNSPSINFNSADTEIQTAWQTLAADCQKQYATKALTGKSLEQAVQHFLFEIAKKQGAKGDLSNTLGFISGTGVNGCTAANDNNEGSCVYYGWESTNKGPLKPEWLEPLNQAVAALWNSEQAAQRAHALADRITALNNTLSSIIHLGAAAATQQKSKANHPTDKTDNSKNAEKAANRECKQHKNNKAACENAGKFKCKGKTKTDGPCEPK